MCESMLTSLIPRFSLSPSCVFFSMYAHVLVSSRVFTWKLRANPLLLGANSPLSCLRWPILVVVLVRVQVGFKMFLGTVATCTNWATDAQGNATECSLILDDIPFVDYVELPPSLSELRYSNILCGVIKGALEQVRFLTTTSNSHVCVTSWDTRFVPCASILSHIFHHYHSKACD